MSALNFRYGCHYPTNWGDDVDDQLRKQVDLWNDLVGIEEAHREAYFRLTAEDPAVASAEGGMKSILDEMERQKALRAERRKNLRSKAQTPEDLALARLRAELKKVSADLKVLRKAVRERSKPALEALDADRKGRVVDARQRSAEGGLWWGNYNAVLASFDVARQKAIKDGAKLRAKHFDGTGRLTAQVQGGMTWDELTTGARSEVRLDYVADSWSALHLTAYARGREVRRLVRVPIMLHRPFPPGARIQSVALKRRRKAPGVLEHSVIFSLRLSREESPDPRVGGRTAAIDIGWRVDADGLRVALLADEVGFVEKVMVPAKVLTKLELCDALQSDFDKALNDFWVGVTARRDWPGVLDAIVMDMRRARRPHPRHLVRLAKAWPDDHAPELREDLSAFLRRDLRDRRRWAQMRENALGYRVDWMRKWAAGLFRRYDRIVIDGHALPHLLTAEGVLTTEQRRMHHAAAPGELRAWLLDAGPRSGVEVTIHEGPSTWRCHRCGEMHKPSDKSALMHECGACGTVWDQDENAARNILAALSERAVAAK